MFRRPHNARPLGRAGRRILFPILVLAGGCAPNLGASECDRDLECPEDRPVCTTGRCVARPGAARPDTGALPIDATPDRDRGPVGDAVPPPADARAAGADGSDPDARQPAADLGGPPPDARAPDVDGPVSAADGAIAAPPDAVAVTDRGVIGSGDAHPPAGDAHPPAGDALPAPPDAWTGSLDARAAPIDGSVPPDGPLPPPDAAAPTPDAGCAFAREVCNGEDDDCDGQIDEGLVRPLYHDRDGDGWGTPNEIRMTCEAVVEGYVEVADDCRDRDADVHPGAEERCNGEDDDCDDAIDEDAGELYFFDGDGDGFGDPDWTRERFCDPDPSWVLAGGDCAPQDDSVHPGAPETCNGIDDDCDGGTDEPSIATCEAPHADGTCLGGRRACVPVCHPGYSDANRMLADGCERGCTPGAGGRELGPAPENAPRHGIGSSFDHWAVAAVVPVAANDHLRSLVLYRDDQPPVELVSGAFSFGQPAVARTQNGWLVATRVTSEFPTPIRLDFVPDVGGGPSPVTLAVDAASDPALVWNGLPDNPLTFVAWIAPVRFPNALTPQFAIIPGDDLRQTSLPQALGGEFLAAPVTPALTMVDDAPVIGFAAFKGDEPKLVIRDLIPDFGVREAADALGAVPVRVDLAVRSNTLVAAVSPAPGLAAEVHRFDLLGPLFLATPNVLFLAPEIYANPVDLEVVPTNAGFVLAHTAAALGAGPETRVHPLALTDIGLELLGPAIDVLAGDGRQLVLASDPSGTQVSGAWVKTGSADVVYAAGRLLCE